MRNYLNILSKYYIDTSGCLKISIEWMLNIIINVNLQIGTISENLSISWNPVIIMVTAIVVIGPLLTECVVLISQLRKREQ